ncbi:MAG: hypothetical protein GW858_13650 [Sphingomonadales bacterium]|nr:hypothetical protein [Sphingomonadales bacterium]NCQ22291.1 hypothetical protein [Sphingomonadales bacterium]NCT04716.1 hypothetical protein [Sphingomonadales bacterium]
MINRLASGKSARLVLGAVAATAMTAASVTPAQAQGRDRDRGGIGAGEIIAGAVVIGGIAALAGAFDGNRNDRRYAYNDRNFRGGYAVNPRTAVDRCVRAAENQARRFGGYRYADVIDIRDVDRTRNGYRVKGRIDVGGGWNTRNDRGKFTCRLDGRGAPLVDFSGVRGLR